MKKYLRKSKLLVLPNYYHYLTIILRQGMLSVHLTNENDRTCGWAGLAFHNRLIPPHEPAGE